MNHRQDKAGSTAPDAPQGLRWQGRALFYSVALSAVAYLAFCLWAGWHDVAIALRQVGVSGVAIALSLSLVNYGLRFLRWQAYLTAMHHAVPWRRSLLIYLAGFALTTTPGKAGETLRSVLLKPYGVPYPQSIGAFFSERLSDLVAVLILAMLGVTIYPAAWPIVAGGALIVAAGLLVLSNATWLAGFAQRMTTASRLSLLLLQAIETLRQARRCHEPRLLLGGLALGLLAWAAEGYAFYLVLRWMGADLPLTFAIFVYAVSMLSGALSFMPGGLGGAEALMVLLLVWAGMDSAAAVAATVLIRLATLWFAVAIGGAALLHVGRNDGLENRGGN